MADVDLAVRPQFALASASPARLALLQAAGIEPEVVVSGVDESAVPACDPATLVGRLASAKALAVARIRPDALILGCDSVLDLDGESLGRPRDADDARERWARMAGRSGTLRTGHCLVHGGTSYAEATATVVHFGRPSPVELAAYLESGEPLRVAGAFTIDGRGAAYVEAIQGDHGTVVGLSLPALRRLLARHGVAIHELWASP